MRAVVAAAAADIFDFDWSVAARTDLLHMHRAVCLETAGHAKGRSITADRGASCRNGCLHDPSGVINDVLVVFSGNAAAASAWTQMTCSKDFIRINIANAGHKTLVKQ